MQITESSAARRPTEPQGQYEEAKAENRFDVPCEGNAPNDSGIGPSTFPAAQWQRAAS
jgi:hypothetical protein